MKIRQVTVFGFTINPTSVNKFCRIMHRAARLLGTGTRVHPRRPRLGVHVNSLLFFRSYSHAGSVSEYPEVLSLSPVPHEELSGSNIALTDPSLFESILNEVESGLVFFHDVSGLPWWATLVVSTVMFRVTVLPLVYVGLKAGQKMPKATPDIAKLNKLYEEGVRARSRSENKAKRTYGDILKVYLKGMNAIRKIHDVSVARLYAVPLAQIPVFVTFVFAMRRMINNADQITSDLAHEGLFWFENLTAPDPLMVLPMFAVGMTFYNLENGLGRNPQNKIFFGLKNVIQGGLICALPFIAFLPSGVFLYWGTSASFVALQTAVIRNEAFLNFTGLALTKVEKNKMH